MITYSLVISFMSCQSDLKMKNCSKHFPKQYCGPSTPAVSIMFVMTCVVCKGCLVYPVMNALQIAYFALRWLKRSEPTLPQTCQFTPLVAVQTGLGVAWKGLKSLSSRFRKQRGDPVVHRSLLDVRCHSFLRTYRREIDLWE